LLHGFPSSSREFDTLIPLLATRYHLVEPGQVLPTIRDLGLRHVAYGVELADYEALREALLWALEQALGEECTPAVREAWTACSDELAGAMKTAAIGA
jgi:hemoglobin-like flavoprotein